MTHVIGQDCPLRSVPIKGGPPFYWDLMYDPFGRVYDYRFMYDPFGGTDV